MSTEGLLTIAGVAVATVAMRKFSAEAEELGKSNQDRLSVNPRAPGYNDGLDAVRHAYVSARLTQLFGADITEMLGDAHEAKSQVSGTNPLKELNMDLWNNKAGRDIGQKLGVTASAEDVGKAILDAAASGLLITRLDDPRQTRESTFYDNAVVAYAKGTEALEASCLESLTGLSSSLSTKFAELKGGVGDAIQTAANAMKDYSVFSTAHAAESSEQGRTLKPENPEAAERHTSGKEDRNTLEAPESESSQEMDMGL